MFKKLIFFISLIILINLTNFTIAEIIPLKKPTQTKIEKEQKLLIDILKPLPKPVLKKSIKKLDENKEMRSNDFQNQPSSINKPQPETYDNSSKNLANFFNGEIIDLDE